MKYKFLGKPDRIFPDLVTGKVYNLKLQHIDWFMRWLSGVTVQIISPIKCPYSSWETFYQNWKLII